VDDCGEDLALSADSRKVAFITGITGQDGSYLAEFLLAKGYVVHGLVRRNSDFTSRRIDPILFAENFFTHYGDVIDSTSLYGLLARIQPDEVYNLAAQSHVGVSFATADYSAQVNSLGNLRLLSAIRELGLRSRFYQASSSEIFGGLPETAPQNEATAFSPRSPYSAAKLFAYWTTAQFREAYGIHASNGLLFNHESPRRGKNFVTKKISQAVARIARGEQDVVRLGNLSAERDWGYAPEYVAAMWQMLQQPQSGDYVIGTGDSYTVRQFVELCFAVIGVTIAWSGSGVDEVGYDVKSGTVRVKVDPYYFRPLETERLRADSTKAARGLGWAPKVRAPELARLMVRYDIVHNDYGFPDLVEDADVQSRLRVR
jgi:GDPmannose 4,6-dehydratase